MAADNQHEISTIGAKVESPNENGQLLAEPKMLVDASTQAPTLTWTQQALLWINGLSLPAIIIAAIKGTRWVTKKEDEMKAVVTGFKSDLTLIKDNHLHTMQESLKEIKKGQDEGFKDLIQATNTSKDAIVQAILLTKK